MDQNRINNRTWEIKGIVGVVEFLKKEHDLGDNELKEKQSSNKTTLCKSSSLDSWTTEENWIF